MGVDGVEEGGGVGRDRDDLPGNTPTLRSPHADGCQVFPSGERVDVTEQLLLDPGGYVSTTADVNTLNGTTGTGRRTVTVSMSTALGSSPDDALRQERAASVLVDHALCDGLGNGRDT
ncbi:hypothetical protein [Kitasatospora sp. NPDC089509]|uniref:hypothetical protein n=1 Tax=Kitasatospora sp. NPDC089509 TaxID=3364079 RepID=UPI00380B9396